MGISVVIPSRNEPYLTKTINDLLTKATGEIEVIAVLEGYWPKAEEIVDDKRVNYIHFSVAKGMRAAINAGVAIAKYDYILKTDAHCMFGQGYDQILAKDCDYDWVVVPRRYALDPVRWEIEDNPKYPIDYMYLDNECHGREWREKNKDQLLESKKIDDLMSSQGSAWFMKKSYFNWLNLMDEENYGMFASEFQEVGLKTWLSGGKVKVNKNTYYCHWHKTVGRGYSLSNQEFEKGNNFALLWKTQKNWRKQRYPLSWLVNKFAPVPTWNETTLQ